jgi:EAL domain-containing protein (putative c-di-GMP-specific phosphodiesterase class I)
MLPYYILFECNESQLINNNLINQFFKLFSKGYYISIDDFGCQQSNFKQLLLLEEFITEIKADMYFTQHYERPLNKIILEFLIKFSFVLQSSTCAEGVETKEQLDALSTLGYHYFQGFYFYPPMSPTDILNLLLTSNNILLHIDKNANNEIIMWSNLDDTNLFDG